MDSDISTPQKRMRRVCERERHTNKEIRVGEKRNMQTLTQKNQGTKVDSEKTLSLPPAKSK